MRAFVECELRGALLLEGRLSREWGLRVVSRSSSLCRMVRRMEETLSAESLVRLSEKSFRGEELRASRETSRRRSVRPRLSQEPRERPLEELRLPRSLEPVRLFLDVSERSHRTLEIRFLPLELFLTAPLPRRGIAAIDEIRKNFPFSVFSNNLL